MNFKPTLSSFLVAICAMLLNASCSTMTDLDPGAPPPQPHIPQVTMPQPQNAQEQSLIGEVERSLEANGLRPTDRAGVEYQLAFSVLQGPVNTDVSIDLIQGRERVVRAFARAGGALRMFNKQQVLREAFDKALRQFEAQLPRSGGRTDFGERDSGGYGNDPYGQPPVPQGNPYAPSPYTQPQPY